MKSFIFKLFSKISSAVLIIVSYGKAKEGNFCSFLFLIFILVMLNFAEGIIEGTKINKL